MECNELRPHIPQVVTCRNRYNFVKKTLQKHDVDIFTFQKSLFLRCNIGTFAEQNRLFCVAKQGVLQSVVSQMVMR